MPADDRHPPEKSRQRPPHHTPDTPTDDRHPPEKSRQRPPHHTPDTPTADRRPPGEGRREGLCPANRRLHEGLHACRWVFPDPEHSDEAGLAAVGADLEPATLVAAYSRGLFPMPLKPGGRIGWWSPPERGVLEPAELVVHRSLRKACRRFEVRVDTAFAGVVEGCADPVRPHGWIDSQMQAAYVRLHREGFAHSVETWQGEELVGGLYGVALGGLFAAESMFYSARDASKVALVALAAGLLDGHPRLIDVQWATPHLRSLGVEAIPRRQYLRRLPELLASPPPGLFTPARDRPQSQ